MPVLKILKTGEVDIDSTDIWRFSYHSKYKSYKIAQKGTTNLTILAGGTTASAQVTHNLGYKPIVFVNILKNGRLYNAYGYSYSGTITATGDYDTDVISFITVDTTKLYIDLYIQFPGDTAKNNETFTAEYFIQLDEI